MASKQAMKYAADAVRAGVPGAARNLGTAPSPDRVIVARTVGRAPSGATPVAGRGQALAAVPRGTYGGGPTGQVTKADPLQAGGVRRRARALGRLPIPRVT